MKTALIIHGAQGSPEENWIPWLKRELFKQSYDAVAPVFPTPEKQSCDTWMKVVEPYLCRLNGESIVIGHSIGATFLLSLLERLSQPVAISALISGFVHDLGIDAFDRINNTFYSRSFDWSRIRNNARDIVILHGSNDPYVPLMEMQYLADQLRVIPTIVQNGGHLNESAGFLELPQLLERLVKFDSRKSLLIPINSRRQILIQDRRGYKKPDWGYFGGQIEEDEIPLEAVIRESKEELGIDILPTELKFIGTSSTCFNNQRILRFFFLYNCNRASFSVYEGSGAQWVSFSKARELMEDKSRFDDVVNKIKLASNV